MSNQELVKWFAAAVGAVLVLVGLLGFVDNPIVGSPANNPIFVTDALHNIVHVVTGVVALYIAFGLRGLQQANALIGYGLLYGAVLILTLISPRLFGLFEHEVNTLDHVLHLALALVSIAIGWLARSGREILAR